MNIKKLSRFLPGFSRKPRSPKPQPTDKPAESKNQPVVLSNQQPVPAGRGSEINNLSRPPVDQQFSAPPTKPSRLLDDVCAFLARYLHCSPEQRTVLALWILHTHSFAAARSTPYLAIQ